MSSSKLTPHFPPSTMPPSEVNPVAISKKSGRRGFLKGAAAGAAAMVAKPAISAAQQVRAAAAPANAAEAVAAPAAEARTVDRPGSDFMLDVVKSLGFEYVFAMPGSSFAGFHESVINYGGNQAPEYITCCHEESSVAMA